MADKRPTLKGMTVADVIIFPLAGACLVAVGMAWLYWGGPVVHYRLRHDGRSFYRIAYRRLKSGNSIEKVIRLLGPGQEPPDDSRERLAAAAQKHPELFPERLLPTDSHRAYALGPGLWIYLQFRNGKLMNFDPDHFKEQTTFCLLSNNRPGEHSPTKC